MNTRQPFDDAAEAEQRGDPDRRNQYFRHRHLTAGDYRLEQAYGIGRRRLLSRAIAGWGVAHGFALALEENGKLACSSGLALDRHGRELVRRTSAPIGTDEVVRLDENGLPAPVTQAEFGKANQYLLQAHYAERRLGPVRTGSACDCGKQAWNYMSETVMFSLRPVPNDCSGTAQSICQKCGCTATSAPMPGKSNRQPHACLCEWSSNALDIADEAGTWNKDVCYSLSDAVPLAFVTVAFDKCCKPQFSELDACRPRRIIKTNDVLFDLIRGCDLTRIEAVSWAGWHDTTVPWKTFKDCFPAKTPDRKPDDEDPDPSRMGNTTFRVNFSRPVRTKTLHAGCVSIRALAEDESNGWLKVLHVPLGGLKASDEGETGLTKSAVIQVSSDWCDDEIWGVKKIFKNGARMEIEIRGDLILDCNGQAVDATSFGPGTLPSGNGTPGGTYFSAFTVQPSSGMTHADTPPQQTSPRTPL